MEKQQMVKQSNVPVPKDLPENEGILLFFWKKGEAHPNFVWDNLGEGKEYTYKVGGALRMLVAYLLSVDSRNWQVILNMMEDVKKRMESSTTVN